MPGVDFTFRGHASSLRAASDEGRAAIRATSRAAVEATRTVRETAQQNIREEVKQREALALLASEYKKVAIAAKTGSEEQVAANRLAAASARKLGIEQATAGIGARTHATNLAHEERALGRVSRGMAESTGIAGKWTKAMGVASTAFIGGALVGETLKSIIEKTKEAQTVQAQLAVTMRNAGLDMSRYRGVIDSTVERLGKMSGFTNVQLQQSFTNLVRSTRDVGKANREMAIAVDLARAKHIDLDSATGLVVKANIGLTRGLKALGLPLDVVTTQYDKVKRQIALYNEQAKASGHIVPAAVKEQERAMLTAAKAADKHATALAAVDKLGKTVSGSAKSYAATAAGAWDRWHRAVDELQISIGRALMPALGRVAGALAKFVEHLNEHNRAGKAAAGFVKGLGAVLSTLRPIFVVIGHWISTVIQGYKEMAGAFSSGSGNSKNAKEGLRVLRGAVGAIATVLDKTLIPMVRLAFKIWAAEIKVGIKIVGGIARAVEALIDPVRSAIATVRNIILSIVRIVRYVADWIRDKIKGAFDLLPGFAKSAVRGIGSAFSFLPGIAIHWGKKAVEGVNDALSSSSESQKAAAAGAKLGSAFGRSLYNNAAPWLKAVYGAGAGADITATAGGAGAPGATSVTAAMLNRTLRGSPMAGSGAAFVAAGRRYGIDPRYLVALAGAETSYGGAGQGRIGQGRNAFGVVGGRYGSYAQAIQAVAALLARSYIAEGRTSVAAIARKYAPVGASNDPYSTNAQEPRNISRILTALGGDPSNILRGGGRGGDRGAMGAGRQKMISLAMSLLGTPYVWGGNAPGGFDCSGFVQYVFGKFGIDLPHFTGAQVKRGVGVSLGSAQAGDVVFTEYNKRGVPQHEGLYIGGGKVEEAPHRGDKVKIVSLADFIAGQQYAIRRFGVSTGGDAGVDPTTGAPLPSVTDLPKKPRKFKPPPLLPLALQTEYAKAALTKGIDDDLRALEHERAYVEAHIKTAGPKRRLALLKALKTIDAKTQALLDRKFRGISTAVADVNAAVEENLRSQRAWERLTGHVRQQIQGLIGGAVPRGVGVGGAFPTTPAATRISLLDPALRPRMETQIAAIRKLMAKFARDGVITPAELAVIQRRSEAIALAFQKGLAQTRTWATARRQAGSEAKALLAQISNTFKTPEIIPLNVLQARIRRLQEIIRTGTNKAVAAARRELAKLAPQVSASVAAAQAAVQEAIQRRQSALETAWGRLASRMMAAFDRVTSKHIAQMQRELADLVSSIQATGAELTPGESALAAFRAQREAAQAAKDMADAQAALADAQAAGDPAAIAAAQDRINQLLLDAQERQLQATADAERKARDADTDAKVKAAQEEEARREQEYQDQRDAQRQALEDQLADWLANLEAKKASWSEFTAWLKAQGLDPNTGFGAIGEEVGSAFLDAWLKELDAAYKAWQEFMSAIGQSTNPWSLTNPPHPVGGGQQLPGGPVVDTDGIRNGDVIGGSAAGRAVSRTALLDALGGDPSPFGGGPRGGGMIVIPVSGNTFLSGDRQTVKDLARKLVPEIERGVATLTRS